MSVIAPSYANRQRVLTEDGFEQARPPGPRRSRSRNDGKVSDMPSVTTAQRTPTSATGATSQFVRDRPHQLGVYVAEAHDAGLLIGNST